MRQMPDSVGQSEEIEPVGLCDVVRRGNRKGNVTMAEKKNQYVKMYLSNNSRKLAGLPMHRKKNAKKRFYTRCEGMETIAAFLQYCES